MSLAVWLFREKWRSSCSLQWSSYTAAPHGCGPGRYRPRETQRCSDGVPNSIESACRWRDDVVEIQRRGWCAPNGTRRDEGRNINWSPAAKRTHFRGDHHARTPAARDVTSTRTYSVHFGGLPFPRRALLVSPTTFDDRHRPRVCPYIDRFGSIESGTAVKNCIRYWQS